MSDRRYFRYLISRFWLENSYSSLSFRNFGHRIWTHQEALRFVTILLLRVLCRENRRYRRPRDCRCNEVQECPNRVTKVLWDILGQADKNYQDSVLYCVDLWIWMCSAFIPASGASSVSRVYSLPIIRPLVVCTSESIRRQKSILMLTWRLWAPLGRPFVARPFKECVRASSVADLSDVT